MKIATGISNQLISFLVDLLNLDGQAWVFLFDGVTYRLVPQLVLFVLLPHQVVPVLNGSLDVFFGGPQEIELHDGVVLELALSDEVEPSLCLRKDSKGRDEVFRAAKPLEVFEYELRVLSELDEKVLVGFDAFELPIVTLKEEVKVHFSVAGQLDLDSFGEPVVVLHHDLHSQHLWLL